MFSVLPAWEVGLKVIEAGEGADEESKVLPCSAGAGKAGRAYWEVAIS